MMCLVILENGELVLLIQSESHSTLLHMKSCHLKCQQHDLAVQPHLFTFFKHCLVLITTLFLFKFICDAFYHSAPGKFNGSTYFT